MAEICQLIGRELAGITSQVAIHYVCQIDLIQNHFNSGVEMEKQKKEVLIMTIMAKTQYELVNLDSSAAVQKCYINRMEEGIGYGYALQFIGDDVRISRGPIEDEEIDFSNNDYMTLANFGHCQSLDYYMYNGTPYFWINLNGKLTTSDTRWATQVGRIRYQGGSTINSYTDVTRLVWLDHASASGSDIGTLKRVESAVSDDFKNMLVMAISTKDDVQFTHYNFQPLNGILDNIESEGKKFIKCNDAQIKRLATSHSLEELSTFLPTDQSVQGIALSNANSIYISSGTRDDTGFRDTLIGKMYWDGTHFDQTPILNNDWTQSLTEIENLQIFGDELYITVTQHQSPNESYVYRVDKSDF